MMTKKLFIFAVVMSGFSFVNIDGNCSDPDSYSNSEDNSYCSSEMDNSEEENDNSTSEEKDWGKNPIFKLAKEFGIDIKDDDDNNTTNNNITNNNEKNKKSFDVLVDKIDYDNGYESPYDENE